MSTICHLDSRDRDRVNNPYPSEFIVSSLQVKGWPVSNRTVQAVRPHYEQKVLNLVHSISLAQVIVPYKKEIVQLPYIYVTFQSHQHQDKSLINTIDSKHSDVQFVCVYDSAIGHDGSIRITDANDMIDIVDENGVTHAVDIPHGSYTNHTVLAGIIQSRLNAAGTLKTWTVVYDTGTGIYTITSTDGGGIDTLLLWSSGPNASTSIGSVLGYAGDSNPNDGGVTIHVGDEAVGLEPFGNLWAVYRCAHEQTYRFETNKDTIHFKISTPDGARLDITDRPAHLALDPAEQVAATFQLTPYVRDGDYSHHLTTIYGPK